MQIELITQIEPFLQIERINANRTCSANQKDFEIKPIWNSLIMDHDTLDVRSKIDGSWHELDSELSGVSEKSGKGFPKAQYWYTVSVFSFVKRSTFKVEWNAIYSENEVVGDATGHQNHTKVSTLFEMIILGVTVDLQRGLMSEI